MTIAPAKIQSVTSHDAQVANLDLFRNGLWFQCPFARPFVDALRTGASTSQGHRSVITDPTVGPRNPQLAIALLRNLSRLDRLPSLCRIHSCCSLLTAHC